MNKPTENGATLRKLQAKDKDIWGELLCQLSPKKKPKIAFDELLGDPNFFGIIVEESDRVVAIGSISFFQSSLKGKAGMIEDMIVDPSYRGKGLGSKLLDSLLSEAEKRKTCCICLTSKPDKTAARRLYGSRGFILSETGFFKKILR